MQLNIWLFPVNYGCAVTRRVESGNWRSCSNSRPIPYFLLVWSDVTHSIWIKKKPILNWISNSDHVKGARMRRFKLMPWLMQVWCMTNNRDIRILSQLAGISWSAKKWGPSCWIHLRTTSPESRKASVMSLARPELWP